MSKSCTNARRKPPPLGQAYDSPAPSLPRTWAERGRGAVRGGRKRAFQRGQTRAGSAAPPPAPRRPTRAAGPLSPRIMHGPGAPSALPPQEDTINVRGGPGRGSKKAAADGGGAARPGRRLRRPRAAGESARPARPKAREQRLGTPRGPRPAGEGHGPRGRPWGRSRSCHVHWFPARGPRGAGRPPTPSPHSHLSSVHPALEKAIVCLDLAVKVD